MDSYSYSTYDTSYSSADAGVTAAAVMGFLLIYFLIIIAMYVVMAIFLGKIFKKAGVPSWIAWVPVYNNWKLLEIGGQKGWWALLAFVPFVNFVSLIFMIIAMYHIGKKLGKEDWFVIVAILLGPVWIIWLAVDDSVWDESKGAPRVDTPTTPVPAAASVNQQPMAPVQQPQTDETTQTPPTPPVNPTI